MLSVRSVRTSRTGRNFAANILITVFKIQIRRLREDRLREAFTATASVVGAWFNAVHTSLQISTFGLMRHETHTPLVQRDVNFP